MKIFLLIIAVICGMTACDSGENYPDPLDRGSAIAQIQNKVPLTYEEANAFIERVCGYFNEGWGAGRISSPEGFDIPQSQQELFAHLIWLSARAGCVQNVRDAEGWQERNGWEN